MKARIKVGLFARLLLILVFCFTLFSFKKLSDKRFFYQLFDDSTYYKLPEEQKRLPKNALNGLKITDSLRVSLFASEPEITNPTNMDVDEKGRIWLCEGYNYRPKNNAGEANKHGDRIVILEDTDGDGHADKTKVFYQGHDVNAALGILILGNKVIVSCSPNVFVFTDEDGDDKADKKEILFTGIGGEQHDHGLHAFVFGPDGKLYFNYGNEGGQLLDRNGKVVKDKFGKEIIANGKPYNQGMIFRCNLDGSEVEVLAHNFRNNFEVAVDSYGSLWQSDNDDDGNMSVRINYVMEYGNYGYKDEITGAGWGVRRINAEKEISRRHWHQDDPGVVPNLLVTGSGSPTGILVYEGDLLPKAFQNQMIHCDAGPKVVRAYPVKKSGAGYKAEIVNLIEGKDNWFRPSDVCVAPDGSLFVADWYDAGVGGHQRKDLKQGRVFRITTEKKLSYKMSTPDLSTPLAAAEALKSPNLSTRYLAWEKLSTWGKKSEKALAKLLHSNNPRHRARAFWLLSKIEDKGKKYIEQALSDPNEDIRVAGIRMARQTEVNILPYLKRLVKDSSSQVRREVAIALRNISSPEAAKIWVELVLKYDGNDDWYLEALGIGASSNWDACFSAWKSKVGEDWNTKAGNKIIWRARSQKALPLLSKIIANPGISTEEAPRLFRAFDFFNNSPEKREALLSLLTIKNNNSEQIRALAIKQLSSEDLKYSSTLKEALYQRLEEVKNRMEFVDLVQKFQLSDQSGNLYNIVILKADSVTGMEAAKALVSVNGLSFLSKAVKEKSDQEKLKIITAVNMLEGEDYFKFKKSIILDENQPLSIRKKAVKALGWGWFGEQELLDMVKEGKLPKVLEPTASEVLFNVWRKGMRDEAAKFLKAPEAVEGKPLPPIIELADRKGSIVNGRTIYNQYCIGCHQVNGAGIDFGPKLSEIGSKLGKDGIYGAIIHPDAGISFGYEGYMLKMKDGSGAVGIIVSETESEVELKMPGGIINKIKISNIIEKSQMVNSLMPANLQAGMSEQELVDLVEYLSSLKKSSN